MSLTAVTITVPDTIGAVSAWSASTLVTLTALVLSRASTSTDTIALCGSVNNTDPVTSAKDVAAFVGGSPPQNDGDIGSSIGAFSYFAVRRLAGTTLGLTFTLEGDDGSSGGGGTVTANQGNPNAGGALSWPTQDRADGIAGAASPAYAVQSGLYDAVSRTLQVPRVYDTDTTGGTEYTTGVILRASGAGGSVETGTLANPLAVGVTGNVNVTDTQGTSPWIVAGNGTAGVSGSAVLTVQGIPGGAAVPATIPTAATAAGSVRVTPDGASFASATLGLAVQITDNSNALMTTSHPGIVAGAGVAGTPAGGVSSVQGVAGGTPVPTTNNVSNTTITSFANYGANATLNVKASAGQVFAIYCTNANAAVRYIQIHNTTTTPAGGATPYQGLSFAIPPAVGGVSGSVIIGTDYLTESGINLPTGIAFAYSTTESTYTAATASEQSTRVIYL